MDTVKKEFDLKTSAGIDFSDSAYALLEIIGRKFRNRSVTFEETSTLPNTHEETRQWIASELIKSGYPESSISEQSFMDGNDKITNLILTVPGMNSSYQIIVGAHYDGDGVGDNGSGLALLLATACGLANYTLPVTVKYVFFDAEETGLIGSTHYANQMSNEEVTETLYMINMDSLAFGDYCCIYGGRTTSEDSVIRTEGYKFAMKRAELLGFKTWKTEDLDGYYSKKQKAPIIEENALYTNPWTFQNPSPMNFEFASPTTGAWGDQAAFDERGIIYINFEATNWFAKGRGHRDRDAFTGYYETDNTQLGYFGMFMNTPYDTWENLQSLFPGRLLAHYKIFSPLLTSLITAPENIKPQ